MGCTSPLKYLRTTRTSILGTDGRDLCDGLSCSPFRVVGSLISLLGSASLLPPAWVTPPPYSTLSETSARDPDFRCCQSKTLIRTVLYLGAQRVLSFLIKICTVAQPWDVSRPLGPYLPTGKPAPWQRLPPVQYHIPFRHYY